MTTTRHLRALAAIARPYSRHLIGMVAAGIGDQALAVAIAAVGAWLVGAAATGADLAELRPWLIVLAVLIPPRTALAFAESTIAHDMAFRVLVDTRAEVYAGFRRIGWPTARRYRTGDLTQTVTDDVERLEVFFAHTLGPLAVAATVPPAAVLTLWFIHPPLVAVAIPIAIGVALAPMWLRRRATITGRSWRDALAQLNALVVDGVQGLAELVGFGGRRRFHAELEEHGRRVHRAQLQHGRRVGIERAAGDLMIGIGMLGVLVVGAAAVAGGRLEGAYFPTVVVLAGTALAPLNKLGDGLRELGVVTAAAERVSAVVEAVPAIRTMRAERDERAASKARTPTVSPTVSFEHVGFRYAPDLPPAVSEVTFRLEPGQTTALVGHSGAGKSTLAHLLLRFADVETGAIRIDGVDIRELSESRLRRLVSFVPQHVYLFNGTVAENIALARPNATDDELEAAARTAVAHDFIVSELPDGYRTEVGEWGNRISGGQRQRIAIARALLADTPILVMDEPVGNLDAESEQALGVAMARVRTRRTTLLVAHRLSTIRTADHVLVLEHGRLVEQGTDANLAIQGGTYVRLVADQLTAAGIAAGPSSPNGVEASASTPIRSEHWKGGTGNDP